MLFVAAAHTPTNWGIWAAVAAVIVDSIVTVIVGWRLTKIAKRETANAVATVTPALQTELANAGIQLIPVIVKQIKEHFGGEDEAARAIRSIGR